MDSTDLQRATLESKDREELNTIAEALGAKPPTRARKADVIDIILKQAGDGENEPPRPPRQNPVSPGDDAANRTKANGGRSDGDNRGRNGGGGGDKNKGGDSREAKNGKGNAKGGERDSSGDKGDDKGSGGRNRSGGGGGDDGDDGNRRRRRRGRDRSEEQPSHDGEASPVEGCLDLREDGYGFLRVDGPLPSKKDAYVSVKQVRQLGLRKGDQIRGASRPASRNEKNPALTQIDEVNGRPPEQARDRSDFASLTPLFPDEPLRMERPDNPINTTARLIDLFAPIGKGQRGLIVAPPKAGKTSVMKEIARSIERNNPEVTVIVVLLDERPEEVTDMARWLDRGEVVASTFDKPVEEHIAVAELTLERAKRLVEYGDDVCLIVDGITRLARAYNLGAPATGRVMSGGVDAGALYPPKHFFGAARNVEEGGSLTILATALVETGSRMDEVIFEEFKGTGNMELRLDRGLAERRLYPAIDVVASGTRHEELLHDKKALRQIWKLREVLAGMAKESGGPAAGLEMLIDRLGEFSTNAKFLDEVASSTRG